jgi:hypothetical protein
MHFLAINLLWLSFWSTYAMMLKSKSIKEKELWVKVRFVSCAIHLPPIIFWKNKKYQQFQLQSSIMTSIISTNIPALQQSNYHNQ